MIGFDLMIDKIRTELQKNADEKNRIGSENYLKGIKFRGLKMNQILGAYKSFKKGLKKLGKEEIIKLSLELLKSEYFEDKRFSIQLLSDNCNLLDYEFVKSLYDYFDAHIYEWATCDVLASKVISKIIIKDNKTAEIMVNWSKSDKNWAKRASIVSFVNLAAKYDFDNIIIEISRNLIKNDFRFIQLAVGWCLRNLGQKNLELVLKFIKENYKYFSREGLRYASEKMEPKLRENVLKNYLIQ